MKNKPHCKNFRVLLQSPDYKPDRLTVARLRCKQWTCDFCASRNLNQWRIHLLKRFDTDFRDTKFCFMTITVPPHLHGKPIESVSRLQDVWGKLYHLMRREYKEKFTYVYMYEAHKSGTYHLHALISLGEIYDDMAAKSEWDGILDHHPVARWLRDTLPSIGAGWKCDIRRVYSTNGLRDSVSAVLYAIKYMSKSKTWKQFKKHARRIGVSQDIGGLPKPKKGELNWSPTKYLTLKDLERYGTIEDLSIGREISEKDFQHGYYPPEYDE
jgi:hypothetical protein